MRYLIQELLGLPGFSDASLLARHGLWTPADLHILAKLVASVLSSVYVESLGIRNKPNSKVYQHFRERGLPYRILRVRLPHLSFAGYPARH